MLYTDECLFTPAGAFNRQNSRQWEPHNPHWVKVIQSKYKWSVMVWAGVIGERVIGPYFFRMTVSGRSYLEFLENELPRLLEILPLNVRRNMWWQQDGAAPHRADPVIEYLNNAFEGRWIGLRGPVYWPPFSPDMTACDFYLWGVVKAYVDKGDPRSDDHARQLIVEAFDQIRRNQGQDQHLSHVQSSIIERIKMCIERRGGHFEKLIKCMRCNPFK